MGNIKEKKSPTRKCVGCCENIEKNNLIRIVKDKNSNIFIDKTGKANGRGTYICNSVDCFDKAIKNKELERSLKCFVNKEIYEELKQIIKNE